MSLTRKISRITNVPPLGPGFLGPGHLASELVSSRNLVANDPFILLIEDHLDINDRSLGGPHPHAGFETVTLILSGGIYDPYEGGLLKEGDLQWLTAGRGIIHNEKTVGKGRVRLLQMWLRLPASRRWLAPTSQTIRRDSAPVRKEPGTEVRVYSGASGSARSFTQNEVPTTLVEIILQPHVMFDQDLPASFNGFIYLLDGSATLGRNGISLNNSQLGWLDRPSKAGSSHIHIVAGTDGARLLLYAGQPQGDPVIVHGPFVGGSRQDIARLHADYLAGKFAAVSELAGNADRMTPADGPGL